LWCLLGAAAAFRPTLACVVLPFALAGQRRVMAGAAVGAATVMLLSLVTSTAGDWSEYVRAMTLRARVYLGETSGIRQEVTDVDYPAVIEGTTSLARLGTFRVVDSALASVCRGRLADSGSEPLLPCSARSLQVTAVVVVIVGCLALSFWRRRIAAIAGWQGYVLYGTVMAMTVDSLAPAARYSYQNMLWLVPLAAVMSPDRSYVVGTRGNGSASFEVVHDE